MSRMACSSVHGSGRCSTTSIETTTSAPDGSLSAPVTLSMDALLRGLHRSQPAAVGDWTAVAVAPALTLSVGSTAPLEVAGTVNPAKPSVTVDLYRSGDAGGKPIARHTVRSSHGGFATSFPAPRTGDYVLVARTAADAVNAAGASAPVPVTLA